MSQNALRLHPRGTAVLLVEADPDARARHADALAAAGYPVRSLAACPDPHELGEAAVVLSDVPSFHWIQEKRVPRLPPIIVLAADDKSGVTACLCGASEWAPVEGESVYLLATVRAVLQPTPFRPRPESPDGARAYRAGDHICSIHETLDEQCAVAGRFIAEGLDRNERCFYVGRSAAVLDRFRRALALAGGDPVAAELSGALLLLTPDAAHLAGGRFEAGRMLRMLREALEGTLDDGFSGLRTCGDMSWLLDEAPGSHQVVEYEGLLNGFFGGARALGMCQYDAAHLPEHLLHGALATHTSAVIDSRHTANPYYRNWPFDEAELARPGEFGSRLAQLRAMAD